MLINCLRVQPNFRGRTQLKGGGREGSGANLSWDNFGGDNLDAQILALDNQLKEILIPRNVGNFGPNFGQYQTSSHKKKNKSKA